MVMYGIVLVALSTQLYSEIREIILRDTDTQDGDPTE